VAAALLNPPHCPKAPQYILDHIEGWGTSDVIPNLEFLDAHNARLDPNHASGTCPCHSPCSCQIQRVYDRAKDYCDPYERCWRDAVDMWFHWTTDAEGWYVCDRHINMCGPCSDYFGDRMIVRAFHKGLSASYQGFESGKLRVCGEHSLDLYCIENKIRAFDSSDDWCHYPMTPAVEQYFRATPQPTIKGIFSALGWETCEAHVMMTGR
jgi:hypothetical protein